MKSFRLTPSKEKMRNFALVFRGHWMALPALLVAFSVGFGVYLGKMYAQDRIMHFRKGYYVHIPILLYFIIMPFFVKKLNKTDGDSQ